jgi:hypothetical protein
MHGQVIGPDHGNHRGTGTIRRPTQFSVMTRHRPAIDDPAERRGPTTDTQGENELNEITKPTLPSPYD